MNGMFWAIGAATVILAGLMSYLVTRRYGWGAAVMLPVVALAATVGMTWQERGLDFAGGIDLLQETLVFASPILGGAAAGILLAWRRRA
jgi:hypothetical protein